ncbi:hypothetical protein LJC42_03630 [Eubacteriales bacterium OttesenSCG-928-K08]|nr:hypothetical protein [Eubacteriales bacterium OttesenSCG-928-K08]
MMNENRVLLNDVYKRTQLSELRVRLLGSKVQDTALTKHLNILMEAYQGINLQALQLLNQYGFAEKEPGSFEKAALKLRMNKSTRAGSSESAVAQLLLRNSTDNMIAMTQSLKRYENAHPTAHDIAKRLLQIEEANISHLKVYIG